MHTSARFRHPQGLPALVASASILSLCSLSRPAGAQAVRVNGPLAHGSGYAAEDVVGFQLSPDGRWAVFLADSEAGDDVFQLFSAPIDGSGAVRRLNAPLVAGGNLVTVWVAPYGGPDIEPAQLRIGAGNLVVYRADQDVDDVHELHAAPIDGSAPPVKLSGTMVSGGDVVPWYLLTPDGNRVLFLADRVTDGRFELWSVPIDGSAPPVRLNAESVPGSGFSPSSGGVPAAVTPDSATVVYRLAQVSAGIEELWSVPADGSASPVRLNAPLVTGGDVLDFRITADGSQVVYLADQETDGRLELWRVPLDASTAPLRVNGALASGGSVRTSFALAPDGTRAVYLADQESPGSVRLWSARLDGSSAPIPLYAAPPPERIVFEVRVSADASRVVFWGDFAENELYEVFSVPIDGGDVPVRLNAALVEGGDVGDQGIGRAFQLTPDGSRVLYWADQEVVNVMELWSVPTDRATPPVRVNAPFAAPGRVLFPYRFTPDGTRVLYLADHRIQGQFELWSAPVAGGVAPLRLSGRLVPEGDVLAESSELMHTGFAVSDDGQSVVYRADQSSNELWSLWSVPIDRSRAPIELSTSLDPGPVLGDVAAFVWTPDGRHLVYAADESSDEDVQVRAAALHPRDLWEPISSVVLGRGLYMLPSPDSAWVAFHERPTCSTPPYCAPSAALLGAPVDGSAPAVRWNPTLGGTATRFEFTADVAHVVFAEFAGGYRYSYGGLFSFPVHGSAAEPTSLTEPPGMLPLEAFPRVFEFVLSPDGARVVYVTSGNTGWGLWSVPIDRSLEPLALAGPDDVRMLSRIGLSDDGRWVVFAADLANPYVIELYRVPIGGEGPPARLGLALAPHADIEAFQVHGDDVLFVADVTNDGEGELWTTPLDPGRGSRARVLSGPSVAGGGVQPSFQVSAVTARAVFLADDLEPGTLELFSVPLDGSTKRVQLSAAAAPGQGVADDGFHVASAGRVVVWAASDPEGVLRLHAAPIDGSSPAVPLGGPFVAGGALWDSGLGAAAAFAVTPDGKNAVYVADQLADEVFELFVVPTDGSRPARRLNLPLPPGGDVRTPANIPSRVPFALSPDGTRVAYLADQLADEVFELFLSPLEPPRPVRTFRGPVPVLR